MRLINKIVKYATNPATRFSYNNALGVYKTMDDKTFLERAFKFYLGYELDLDNPKTLNEKLQWLKLNDRRPEYTMMVDKYKVREYIADKLGEEYLIPLIGVWDDPDDIDFDALPNQFVLKCNHNSGLGMCICKDKSKLDLKKVKDELRKGIKQDYYLTGREWPYKDVPRKIICEKYMIDHSDQEISDIENNKAGKNDGLNDYKFMCFNGKVQCSFVCSERFSTDGLKVTFFDKDWNVLPFERHYPKSQLSIPKPINYEKMIEFSEKLAEGIPFVRIDFYEIDRKLYFGEMTFFPGSGFEEFDSVEWDNKLGDLISLPQNERITK